MRSSDPSPVPRGRRAASRAAALAFLAAVPWGCASSGGGSTPQAAPTRAQAVSGEMVRLSNEAYSATAVIPEPIDVVWPRVRVAYEILDIPVAWTDEPNHQLGNREFRPRRIGGERLSRFLDCGQGVTARANADTYRVTMSVITTLRPESDSADTHVETLVQASARSRDTASRPIPCGSKGQLERMIAEMVGRG